MTKEQLIDLEKSIEKLEASLPTLSIESVPDQFSISGYPRSIWSKSSKVFRKRFRTSDSICKAIY